MNDDLVDRLHDAELDEEQALAARALIAKDPRAAARFGRLRFLGDLVREVETDRTLPLDFTDRVMAGLPAESHVASLRPRRFAFAGVAVASALAAAAAIAFWVSGETPRGAPLVAQKSAAAVSARPLSSLDLTEPVAEEMVAEAPPVSIESVDFGATQGAIFLVSAGVTDTMVVWTLDEPLPRPVRPRR